MQALVDMVDNFGGIEVYIPHDMSYGGSKLLKGYRNLNVIETGTGNCHIYVHESADFDKALNIIVNAKTQRVGVCNAAESLLVDRAVADALMCAMASSSFATTFTLISSARYSRPQSSSVAAT